MTLLLQLSFLSDLSRRVKTDADRAAIKSIIGTDPTGARLLLGGVGGNAEGCGETGNRTI